MSQRFIALDDPQTEDLTHVQETICIAVLFFQFSNFFGISDAAGNDPVHKGATEGAVFIDILPEAIFQPPRVDLLIDTFQQFPAVVVDQLAGQHDDAGFSCLETLI